MDTDFIEVQELSPFSRLGALDAIEVEIERLQAEGPEAEFKAIWLRGRLHERRAEYAVAAPLLLRTLRRIGLRRDLAVAFRFDLVHLYTRMGDRDRAERLIRRTLAKVDFARVGVKFRGMLLNHLGRIYRRRGALTLASEVYKTSIALCDPYGMEWVSGVVNTVDAELRADRLENAREMLDLLPLAAQHPAGRLYMFFGNMAWLTYWLELGEADECDPHLDELRDRLKSVEGPRHHALLESYQADVFLLRGRYDEAAAIYDRLLAEAKRLEAHADLAPSLARGLAESLMRLGQHGRAEEHAAFAVRTGELGDRLDQLIALRLLGECRWELGRYPEARETLLHAASLHTGIEFGRERGRLARTLRLFQIVHPLSALLEPPATPRVNRAHPVRPTRWSLRDGGEFLTLDQPLMLAVQAAAASDLPVLIEGETGTGKEMVAHLIHELSSRDRAPFVVADCATLPDSLVEAELFGVVRGAFTGCSESRDGIVARANGGTLFLDELPELSLASQGKLLRLLQERTYRRVGEQTPRRVDARFIAATNRTVDDLLAARRLKPDLFHRLNGHRIHLRPLRERREEIGPIARMVLEKMGLIGITEAAVRLLERQDWPGNVRQLEMTLRVLSAELRPGEVLDEKRLVGALPRIPEAGSAGSLRQRRIDGEKHALLDVMRLHDGNVSAAARSLGMSRQALYKALRRTGAGASP